MAGYFQFSRTFLHARQLNVNRVLAKNMENTVSTLMFFAPLFGSSAPTGLSGQSPGLSRLPHGADAVGPAAAAATTGSGRWSDESIIAP